MALYQATGIGGIFGIPPPWPKNFRKYSPGDFEKIRHFVPEIEENGKISLNLTK